MKKSICSILAFVFLAFSFITCDNNPGISSGVLVSHSPCKSEKLAGTDSGIPDTSSCIEYSYNTTTHELSLTHINAGFNCCPGELSCIVSLSGDTIIIHEYEEAPLCDCNCLYDLEIEIDNVNEAGYQVKFIEPYVGDQAKLEFAIDLTNETSGSFCVVRTQYPWMEF